MYGRRVCRDYGTKFRVAVFAIHIRCDQRGVSELLWLCPELSGVRHMFDFSPAALIIPENIVGFYKDKGTSWTVHLTF